MKDLTNKLAFSLLLVIFITTLITSLAFLNYNSKYVNLNKGTNLDSSKVSISIIDPNQNYLENNKIITSNSDSKMRIKIED